MQTLTAINGILARQDVVVRTRRPRLRYRVKKLWKDGRVTLWGPVGKSANASPTMFQTRLADIEVGYKVKRKIPLLPGR